MDEGKSSAMPCRAQPTEKKSVHDGVQADESPEKPFSFSKPQQKTDMPLPSGTAAPCAESDVTRL
jgi:hypothetical protein